MRKAAISLGQTRLNRSNGIEEMIPLISSFSFSVGLFVCGCVLVFAVHHHFGHEKNVNNIKIVTR